MRVAAAAWPLEWHADRGAYADKLDRWFRTADADLLVFPEYAGMEASLIAAPACDTPDAWIALAATAAPWVLDLHMRLARRHGVHCLVGSLPVDTGAGYVNRAYLVSPDGGVLWQDKRIPTPWERARTSLMPGDPLMVADTALGRIGILVCHDAEFPPHARALDCDLLLVPACTDTDHGAARVRTAAMARALEGPCVAVLAQTVGDVAGCCFLDANSGRAGIYGPADTGFPATGILAEGPPLQAGWTSARIPMDALARLKAGQGEVSIGLDWPRSELEERAPLRPFAM